MDRKGWKQKELESASGISQGTISNYLRGVRKPTVQQVSRLAVALGVTPQWLVYGAGYSSTAEYLTAVLNHDHDSENPATFEVEIERDGIAEIAKANEEQLRRTEKKLKKIKSVLENLLSEL